ncbi:ATP-binding protein, partial [Streptomyces sp. NPDC052396]
LPDLAMSLNNLSVDLGEVGRREEGLAAIREAADHYRALAEANPDAYLPDLAGALNNLSIRLGEVGRREEGLAAIREAADHNRALAEANPDAY